MKNLPWVIKIGGAALSNPEAIKEVALAVAQLKHEGHPVVLVHGGGPMINARLTELGITWSFFEGQRITTHAMMAGITEALGEVNQMICQSLEEVNVSYAGVPADMHKMFVCEQMKAEHGLVGEVVEVNKNVVDLCLEQGITPVIAPIGVDENGVTYNINADWAASKLAVALEAKVLLYCTDQRGVLDLNGLPYDSLTLAQLRILMEKGGVTGGMLAKARTIEFALTHGLNKVTVTHALEMCELVETKTGGTLCTGMSLLDYRMKVMGERYVAV